MYRLFYLFIARIFFIRLTKFCLREITHYRVIRNVRSLCDDLKYIYNVNYCLFYFIKDIVCLPVDVFIRNDVYSGDLRNRHN